MQTMEREAAAQLNDLGEFDQDEFSAARQSIKKVFIESFGDPTVRTAPAIRRGKTSWHGFVADNFQNKKQKMSQDPENEGTRSRIAEALYEHFLDTLSCCRKFILIKFAKIIELCCSLSLHRLHES